MSEKLTIGADVDRELAAALQARAEAEDRSKAQIIRRALRNYLASDEDAKAAA